MEVEGFDDSLPTPKPVVKRRRGPNKPPAVEGKRRRRSNSQAKVALALISTHLEGVYRQMDLLKEVVQELREELS